MKSSGLIFLVIVAIWAAYLTQQWVRRRDHLATARSVDRFSDSMRVLERRRERPHQRLSLPLTMSDGQQDRPAPQVSVSPPRLSLRAGASPMNQSTPSSSSTPPSRESKGSSPVTVGNRAFKAAGSLTPAKIRGIAFLAVVALFLLAVVLTPFGLVPWWSPLLMLVALAGTVAWLRSSAVKAAHARSGRTSDTAPQGARRAPQGDRPQAPRKSAPASAPESEKPAPHQMDVAPAAHETDVREPEAVFDVAAVMEQARPAAPQTTAAQTEQPLESPAEVQPDPGAWQPVDVPRPTYTMKARAERAEVAPAPTTQRPTSYADVPVEDLPFDGNALDEELEELPSVHRAG